MQYESILRLVFYGRLVFWQCAWFSGLTGPFRASFGVFEIFRALFELFDHRKPPNFLSIMVCLIFQIYKLFERFFFHCYAIWIDSTSRLVWRFIFFDNALCFGKLSEFFGHSWFLGLLHIQGFVWIIWAQKTAKFLVVVCFKYSKFNFLSLHFLGIVFECLFQYLKLFGMNFFILILYGLNLSFVRPSIFLMTNVFGIFSLWKTMKFFLLFRIFFNSLKMF